METVFTSCQVDEADRLTEIAHASKRYWGYPESYIEAWRASLTITREMLQEEIINAARIGKDTAGFYQLIPQGERAELEAFWVDPKFIGNGAGRSMFDHAVETARQSRARVMDITSDPNAEGFYNHLGAVRVGEVYAPVCGTERYLPRLAYTLPEV